MPEGYFGSKISSAQYDCSSGENLECTSRINGPITDTEADVRAACNSDASCVQYNWDTTFSYGFKCDALGIQTEAEFKVCVKPNPPPIPPPSPSRSIFKSGFSCTRRYFAFNGRH